MHISHRSSTAVIIIVAPVIMMLPPVIESSPPGSVFGKTVEKSNCKSEDNDDCDYLVKILDRKNCDSPEYKDKGPEVPDDTPSGVDVSKVAQKDQESEGDQDDGPEYMSEFHMVFIKG